MGTGIVLGFALAALGAPVLAPHNPVAVDPSMAYRPPDLLHPFGTDRFGFDVFSRVLHGARTDLWIVGASTLWAFAIGAPLGLVAGYRRGLFDAALLRSLEIIQAFPPLILAMAVVAALGQDTANVVLVTAALGGPYYARLVRAEVLSKRGWPFVEAARSVGCSEGRVILVHVLPNCLGSSIAYSAVNAAWALLVAAGLGFLGLGVRNPTPEWGLMISMGTANVMTGEWWVAFFPGLAMVTLTLGLYLVADGLRDALDPRSSR